MTNSNVRDHQSTSIFFFFFFFFYKHHHLSPHSQTPFQSSGSSAPSHHLLPIPSAVQQIHSPASKDKISPLRVRFKGLQLLVLQILCQDGGTHILNTQLVLSESISHHLPYLVLVQLQLKFLKFPFCCATAACWFICCSSCLSFFSC